MSGMIHSVKVQPVILESIKTGEWGQMPVLATSPYSVGDIVCYEPNVFPGAEFCDEYAYVEVLTVEPYHCPVFMPPMDRWRLITFKLVTNLSDLTAL